MLLHFYPWKRLGNQNLIVLPDGSENTYGAFRQNRQAQDNSPPFPLLGSPSQGLHGGIRLRGNLQDHWKGIGDKSYC